MLNTVTLVILATFSTFCDYQGINEHMSPVFKVCPPTVRDVVIAPLTPLKTC